MKKKIYYPELDIIKGIAIITVICQHTVPSSVDIPLWLNQFLHVFSMPLFMMASGFLFTYKDNWHTFLKKKIVRLLIPYLTFGLITILLRTIGGSISRGDVSIGRAFVGLLIGDYYWFLYALFIIMVICKALHKWYFLTIIALASFFGSYFFQEPKVPFIIDRLVTYPFYFIIGMGFNRIYSNYLKAIQKSYLTFSVLLTFLFVFCLTNYIQSLDSNHIAQLMGCAMCWTWSVCLVNLKFDVLSDFLKHFGHYSLQYYLNHLCISLGFLPAFLMKILPAPIAVLFLCVLVRITLSWVALQVQLRTRFFKPLCGL